MEVFLNFWKYCKRVLIPNIVILALIAFCVCAIASFVLILGLNSDTSRVIQLLF